MVVSWYKKILADRGIPRAFDLDERSRDPYISTPKVHPTGEFGGRSRGEGFPKGISAIEDKEEEGENTKNLNEMEDTMHIDPEVGIGEGTGHSKQEPWTSPEEKLYRMDEKPEPIGPHNMPVQTGPIRNRLTNEDIFDFVSKKLPKNKIRST